MLLGPMFLKFSQREFQLCHFIYFLKNSYVKNPEMFESLRFGRIPPGESAEAPRGPGRLGHVAQSSAIGDQV